MSSTPTEKTTLQTSFPFSDTEKVKKGVYGIAVTLVALGVIFGVLVLIAQRHDLNWGAFNPVVESLGKYSYVPLVTSGSLLLVLIAGGIIWKKCSAEETKLSPALEEFYLSYSVQENKVEEIQTALAQGKVSNPSKLLFEAAPKGHLKLVQLLLENGASPQSPDGYNFSALERVIYSKEIPELQKILDMMTVLIDKDPGLVNTCSSITKCAPLHLAVGTPFAKEKVQLLIDWGANVNARDEMGVTPLLQVVQSDTPPCIDVIEILMTHGANLAPDCNRNTFQSLVKEKHSDWLKTEGIQERLKKCGIDMNT